MVGQIFSLKVFFILLRETFESAIIISILLSFLKQNFHKRRPSSSSERSQTNTDNSNHEPHLVIDPSLYRSLQLQVWAGAFLGLFICLLIGSVFVGLFYYFGENYWSKYEKNWEALFSVISSLIISIMGLSLLRINSMQKKWQVKLSMNMSKQLEQQQQTVTSNEEIIIQTELGLDLSNKPSQTWREWFAHLTEKYSLMILPMVTLLREGLEAIFVISGVSASEPVSALPLSAFTALSLGILIGVSLYKGGNKMRLQIFLIGSTCFLYMVSAGLMSRGVWFFELEQYVQNCHGQDMTEVGNGPGSYDIANTIWHVNCCSGVNDGGWMLLNALVGWNNTATYGSVLSYNLYWVFIVVVLKAKLYEERHGYSPFLPARWQLKKIRKRYTLIKFNIDNNVNYKSTGQLYEYTDGIDLANDEHRTIDDESDASTSLLQSRGSRT